PDNAVRPAASYPTWATRQLHEHDRTTLCWPSLDPNRKRAQMNDTPARHQRGGGDVVAAEPYIFAFARRGERRRGARCDRGNKGRQCRDVRRRGSTPLKIDRVHGKAPNKLGGQLPPPVAGVEQLEP